MTKGRLEAFSDGVIAILITIMVLELKIPREPTWAGLASRWVVFLAYVLSYVYLGVYWVNHHHLMSTVRRVDGPLLWLNSHLLFWLSLIPFVTDWLGESKAAPVPTICYGVVNIMAGVAYSLLNDRIAGQQEDVSLQKAHRHHQRKGRLAVATYAVALVLAGFGWTVPAVALYAVVAAVYFVPSKQFEASLGAD
jgi:uncharacterized membrane protein